MHEIKKEKKVYDSPDKEVFVPRFFWDKILDCTADFLIRFVCWVICNCYKSFKISYFFSLATFSFGTKGGYFFHLFALLES